MAGKDLAGLEADLRALRARIEAQAVEIADQAVEIEELRGARPNRDQPVSRRHLLAGLAGLGVAGVASVATAEPAAAADGDALLLGQANTSSTPTELMHTVGPGNPIGKFGLQLTGDGNAALAVASEPNPEAQRQMAIWGWIETTRAADAAVLGESVGGVGVAGLSTSATLPATSGYSRAGGPGLGGSSADGGPQLWLEPFPSETVGPPSSGSRQVGQIKADGNGDLWICVEAGTPGSWTRLLREDTTAGRVIPITPARVLDTRSLGGRASGGPLVPGQTQGPIAHLQTLTLDLAGVAPIPAAAKGVVGNATIVTPSGGGYLRVYPAGTSVLTSTVNFAKGSITANGFTCALSATGLSTRASIVGAGTYHLVLDVTAYIT
ncbi:MAG: hypothetical protein ACOYXM_09465 [Actinomycetota bacterium]